MPGVSRRTRVLVTADAVGGVWRYTLELVRGLAEFDVESVIAVLGPAPSTAQLAEANALAPMIATDLALDWTAEDEATLHGAAAALRALAEREAVDLVHLHAPALAGFDAWPVPVVSVAHSCLATWWRAVRATPLPEDFRWRVAATARGLAASDAVIAPSRSFADALRAEYGTGEITVVHNGTRDAEPADMPRQAAVLTVGRLWDEGKNIAALDRIAMRIAAPVLAAGPIEGPNGAAIRLHRVRHLGTLDPAALRRVAASAAIYASPARYEPFGLGVLEAAQAGMALVLSDIPTFRELWDGAAVFVSVDDEDGMVQVLANLLAAPGASAAMGARARERAGRYTAEAMARGTVAVHRTVLRSRPLASVA